ncbi:Uncharacterised protein [Mycobacterium tuberculosis]|nr:Uncharacterised protein [Mycobacterium tuberculosis]
MNRKAITQRMVNTKKAINPRITQGSTFVFKILPKDDLVCFFLFFVRERLIAITMKFDAKIRCIF